jgi:hypothetical protein
MASFVLNLALELPYNCDQRRAFNERITICVVFTYNVHMNKELLPSLTLWYCCAYSWKFSESEINTIKAMFLYQKCLCKGNITF